MGAFINGTWREGDFPHDTSGRFVRPDSPFRNWITASGDAGPSGLGGFKAEAGRYHLIISLACPWAHRTLIFRRLKGLESMISLSVVHWLLAERGWTFDPGRGLFPTRSSARKSSASSMSRRVPTTAAGSQCRCFGIRRRTQSSTTNRRKSSACSIAPSMGSARRRAIIIRAASSRRSTKSTIGSIERSTMASIAPVSPPRRRLTKKRSRSCSRRLIGWRRGSPISASSSLSG